MVEETTTLPTLSANDLLTEPGDNLKASYTEQDKDSALNLMNLLSTTKPTSTTTSAPAMSSCTHSKLYRHVTLVGGLRAGNFTRMAEFTNMDECTRRCCAERSCDVAILMRGSCFGLQCSSPELCNAKPARLKNFSLKMIYMYREESKGMFELGIMIKLCTMWKFCLSCRV